MKKSNITDVAKKANVSKTTVSNYLNNKANKLSDETKKRIESVIKELNYVPAISARKLSLKKSSKTIGIVMEQTSIESSLSDVINFFSNIFIHVKPLFEEFNYKYIIIPDQNLKMETMIDYIKGLCSSRLLDGIMLMNIQQNDAYILELKKLNFPFVCFGHTEIPGVNNFIATNHDNSIYQAVNTLLKEQVKSVYCNWTQASAIVHHQYDSGYRKAIVDNNMEVNENYIIGKDDKKNGSLVNDFIKLFKSTDQLIGLIIPASKVDELQIALRKTNKKIRKDVLLILYDYFPSLNMEERYYSYIKTPARDLGISAFNMLNDVMENKINEDKNLFDAEIIINLSSKLK